MNWLGNLERKFGKYAISNLMYYIIILYGAGFIIDLVSPGFYSSYLSLNASAILSGQVWRIFTFLIHAPSDSIIFIIFSLYLYYMIGTNLEARWGAFRFNVYFFMGVLMHVIVALLIYAVTGMNMTMDTWFLNMSLFFAFAAVYPDVQFMLFFIIPVKVKYLAWLNGAYFVVTIVQGLLPASVLGIPEYYKIVYQANALAAVLSILNFIIFYFATRNYKRLSPKQARRRRSYRQETKQQKGKTRHKCAVCGRTEEDDENLEFRYCSKCEGTYEYCQDHLFTHTHVGKH